MNSFMISCHKATFLVEKRDTEGLTLAENFSLGIHTILCEACKRYEKQSRLLEVLLKRHTAAAAASPAEDVAAEILVQTILKKIGQ
jgi:hypothetical protein